jgi:hypothetical protein
MVDHIHVVRNYCPFWERTVYDLWDDSRPVIPANNYLRAHLEVADSTLADKAYSILPFFRFLQRNSIEFFELTPQSLNPLVQHFRNQLMFRVRKGIVGSDDISSKTETTLRALGYARAKCILTEVRGLCEWWNLVTPRRPIATTYLPGRGLRTWNRAPRDCFTIGSPKKRKKFHQNHAMKQEEVDAVWMYLSSEARPSRSALLIENPTGPKRGWTSARTAAWKRDQQRFRERLAWFHR